MISQETLHSVQLIIFDFDGVFTDNFVYVDQNGIESVRCWRSDGIGISRIRAIGVKTYIISTEINPVVKIRADKMNIECLQGVQDKASAVSDLCKKLKTDPFRTMFVGNDINDIPAFNFVGVPVAVSDAYPEIFPHVLHHTKKAGGLGAVREICDLVFNAKKMALPKKNHAN